MGDRLNTLNEAAVGEHDDDEERGLARASKGIGFNWKGARERRCPPSDKKSSTERDRFQNYWFSLSCVKHWTVVCDMVWLHARLFPSDILYLSFSFLFFRFFFFFFFFFSSSTPSNGINPSRNVWPPAEHGYMLSGSSIVPGWNHSSWITG